LDIFNIKIFYFILFKLIVNKNKNKKKLKKKLKS